MATGVQEICSLEENNVLESSYDSSVHEEYAPQNWYKSTKQRSTSSAINYDIHRVV